MLDALKKKRSETVPPRKKYDEYKLLPQFWAWVLLLAWSASLILWALWIHAVIPESERRWDYGETAFTPAESIYSTAELPREMKPVRQLPVLPEARPLEAPR